MKSAMRISGLLALAFSAAAVGSLPSAAEAEDTASVRIVAGPDWIPFANEPWIEPGSALDFLSVVPHHTPAGKFGRVVVRGGHFEFEGLSGVPQRFYGVNVCGTANLPDTAEQAERFAANLARIGYNAIRFHHHERWMVSEDGRARADGNGTRTDPALQAKFDLLVAACVKHGIYLTTDLYVSRADAIPWRALGFDRDGTVPGSRYKILCAFHEPTFANLRAWTRSFLSHINPHTGRSLADEPALACLALVNEGSLGNWGAATLREHECVREAWQAWLSAKAGDAAFAGIPDTIPDSLYAKDGATPAGRHAAAFAIFLADAETRLFERLRGFVRDELGCKAPLSNLSDWYEPVQYALPRKGFDYVDAHFYVDLPQFLGTSWQLPSRCPNANPMLGENRGVPGIVWRRQEGKPFCVTEFNYAGPGRFRGVGGIATGAIAALQDWGGLWRFAWSHSRTGVATPEKMAMSYFNLAGDPLSLAAERAALCLFLRGDAAPLKAAAPFVLDEAALRDPRNGAPRLAPPGGNAGAWTRRVGTRVASAASRQSGAAPLSGPSALSGAAPLSGPADLSQLTPEGGLGGEAALTPGGGLNPNVAIDPETGTFLLDTPRTAGGFAESGTHVAGPLRFSLVASHKSNVTSPMSQNGARDLRPATCDGGDAVAATVWVSSLDGEPIASSSHLLLTHLTDVQNSGVEYADPAMTTLLKWGSLPHLMRRGAARVELTLDAKEGRHCAANAGKAGPVITAEGGSVIAAVGRPVIASEAGPVIGGKPAWRVYRLSPSGRRMGEVPSVFENGTLRFTARTDLDPATATFLYELVRDLRPAPRPKVAVFGGGITADNAASLTGPDRFHPNEACYERVKDIQVEFLRNCL